MVVRTALILVVTTLVAIFVPVATQEHSRCAVCQMNRRETRLAGVVATSCNEESECSRYYREHVEPNHTHDWVRGTWFEAFNVFGVMVSGSNVSGRAGGPVVRFSSHEVKLMYESCPDSEKVRWALLKLAKWAPESTVEREEQIEIERKLARWVDSACVAPWPLEDGRQKAPPRSAKRTDE